jgi:hypothetical protein
MWDTSKRDIKNFSFSKKRVCPAEKCTDGHAKYESFNFFVQKLDIFIENFP